MNEKELKQGLCNTKSSWHYMYRNSAWVFIGGLPYDLTEGDVLAVFSQYGEIVNLHLVRDKSTGKSKGFGFLCYMDQRSTVLAVDNLNSIKCEGECLSLSDKQIMLCVAITENHQFPDKQILGRVIRVDHCENYKVPKEHDDDDDITRTVREHGVAPQPIILHEPMQESSDDEGKHKKKKKKGDYQIKDSNDKKKKEKKAKKEKRKKKSEIENSSESSDSDTDVKPILKKEKLDPGYDKYASKSHMERDTGRYTVKSEQYSVEVKKEKNGSDQRRNYKGEDGREMSLERERGRGGRKDEDRRTRYESEDGEERRNEKEWRRQHRGAEHRSEKEKRRHDSSDEDARDKKERRRRYDSDNEESKRTEQERNRYDSEEKVQRNNERRNRYDIQDEYISRRDRHEIEGNLRRKDDCGENQEMRKREKKK